jgi:hypothetical protein
MDYQIAIPSSNRSDLIQEMTLAFLQQTNVDTARVDIHVRSEQYDEYLDALDPKIYGNLISFDAPIGVMHARNHIAQFYEKGTQLLCMDDDIETIKERFNSPQNASGAALRPFHDVEAIIREGFIQTELMGCRLWGIHYANRALFMPVDIRVGLTIIAGGFFGYVVQHTPEEFVTIDNYEDVERSLQFYTRDKGLIRLDKYTTVTQSNTLKGGMQDYRTGETRKLAARYLADKYPNLCRYYVNKQGEACVKTKDQSEIRKRVAL